MNFGSNFLIEGIKIIVSLCLFIVAFTIVVYSFWQHHDWSQSSYSNHWFANSNRFYSDLFAILGIAILFFSKRFIGNFIFFSFLTVLGLIYFIQTISFSETGHFLPSIALENARHTNFLSVSNILITAAIWLFGFIFTIYLFYRFSPQKPKISARIIASIGMILCAVMIKNDDWRIDTKTEQNRVHLFIHELLINHDSPLSEFFSSINEYLQYLKSGTELSPQLALLANTQAAKFHLNHYNETLGASNPNYPLVRELLPKNPLVNSQSNTILNVSDKDELNLIVFYVEGMSSRIIQPYSNLFPQISPNIESFSKKSTVVENYYNHTHATYRGLAGQLCSNFPIGKPLKKTHYYCLPHVLSEHNYDTRFMFSQTKEKSSLFYLLQKTGFNDIDSYEEIVALSGIRGNGLYNSDKSLVKALITRLNEHSKTQKPFFIGLYNIETHNGFKIGTDGSQYKVSGRDKNNYILDTFYNFDVAFGEFWQYFKKSSLYDNTVVILTSDHAKWPSDDYAKLVQNSPNWQAKFSDQIPFIIYHPNAKEGIRVNAKSASSIDFTPSTLHLLDVSPNKTAFLGSSIFDKNYKNNVPILSGTASLFMNYLNDSKKWQTIRNNDVDKLPESQERVRERFKYIEFQQSLERANLLWPSDH